MKRNYQKMLDELLDKLEHTGKVPGLLLHSCCAPCSSYVLEYLSGYFHITVFYYNPNIYPDQEYQKRVQEQKRFICDFPAKYPIHFVEGVFEKERFFEATKGLEEEKEGGARCRECFSLRLEEAAKLAHAMKLEYFTTTLSISPLKNAVLLNELGEELGEKYDVKYLFSDFKKRNGYQRSVELSREYGMYRQDYCGCVYSYRQRLQQKEAQQKAE